MTEFDTWLKAEEQKKAQKHSRISNIQLLTYGLMIMTSIFSIKVLMYKTISAYIIGFGVLFSIIYLAFVYQFRILKNR